MQNKLPLPALALTCLALSGLASSCIISVTGDGAYGFHDDWSAGDEPRVRGNGVSASQIVDLPPFAAVHVENSIDVEITAGREQLVEIFADSNLLERVELKVVEGTLEISMDRKKYRTRQELYVAVAVPDLRAVTISGASDVRVADLDEPSFEVSVSGSGDVRAAGNVGFLAAGISGSGDLHLYKLQANEGQIRISGSGDVFTSVANDLNVRISGSGDVHYKGRPQTDVHVSGSGDVTRSGD